MSVVDEIKRRLDIVEFIGSYVPLQKAGRNFKALCPFHTEKTPSFIVFAETQSWHCFGACSTGGDIFGFAMRQENMTFSEALRFLAERAGVSLRPLDGEEAKRKDEIDRLRAVNSAAAQHYHRVLMAAPAGESAVRYLEGRGVSRETMATFQLGYAVDDWHDLEQHLRRAGISQPDMLAAGLLSESDSGNVYDRFRGRLVFPIRDVRGQVIGFAGRVLDDSVPKYLNSPQTSLFDKGSVLYGIDLARRSIRETGRVIIVEGYMGVIVLQQCGVPNVVACMGTALTERQLRILKPMTEVLILALDADTAGRLATERGVRMAQELLKQRVVPVLTARGLVRYEEHLDAEIRILVLPEGLDPDELVLRDRARWDALVTHALSVADYFFETIFQEVDTSTAKGKRVAVERLLPVIAALGSPVERAHYLQRLAQTVRVDERDLARQLDRLRLGSAGSDRGRARARAQRSPEQPVPDQAAQPAFGLEERCLALLLQTPTMLLQVTKTGMLGEEAFQDARNREVFASLRRFVLASPECDDIKVGAGLDTDQTAHVEWLLDTLCGGPPFSPEMAREDLVKCSMRLRKKYLSHLIGELRFVHQDAQEHGTEERVRELNEIIDDLTRDYLQIDQRAYAATLAGRSGRDTRIR
ncbi:MAG: DNA primase [Anaerolineales bacterium]|nr:MAG: DNA primase [Anaerolineales bacterium]